MRYYYDDPIKASWMRREHGIKFSAVKVQEADCNSIITPLAEDFNLLSLTLEFVRKFGIQYIVDDDSYESLKPRVGDYGGNGDNSGYVDHIDYELQQIFIEIPSGVYGVNLPDFILEKRDNKMWFAPEVGE